MKQRNLRYALGLSLFYATANLALTAPVFADDTNPPLIEKVEVTGHHYDNSVGSSDAASQGVVSGELLLDLPLLRPGEVLETVPGVVVTQHSGDGKANQYFLRGYNLDHGTDFASFVDGVPVNMPTNAHGQGYSDLNFLIPELVNRIDYAKGPYFAQSGDFSSAGSADIRYRKSLDHNFANLTVGDNGYYRAVIAGSCVTSGLRCSLSSDTAAGPVLLGALEAKTENGPWVLPEDLRELNGLLRLSDGSAAQGWSLDAMLYDSRWNATDQVPLALIQSGQLNRYGALDPTDGGNTGRAILSGEWHTSDAQNYTKVAAYAEHYRLQLWSDFTYFELRPATGDQFEQAEHRNLVGGQIIHGWDHSLWGLKSTTEAGFQVRHDNIDVGLFNTRARNIFQTVTNEVNEQTASALYIQNTTYWTSWFRSLAGLRGDHIDMRADSLVTPENSGNASASKLSPKLSLIFGPWERSELFVNAGKGFHSNDARGVVDKVDPTTGQPSSGVPALVSSFGKEIGVRTEIVPGLQSSLALWTLDSDSELVYNADSSIGSTSPNGASKRRGVEWNNHWVADRRLLFDADFAWTHARYARNNDNGAAGDMIPNAVSKVFVLRATAHDLGPWTLAADTRYIGRYPLSQDGTLVGPSAIVTNLRLQRRLTPKITLALDTLNLFNHQYFDIAYQQDYQVTPASPVVPSGITVHPGEPRELRLSLNIKF